MSRFWGKADSSSESDGSDDSDSLEEVQNQRTVGSKFQGAFESESGEFIACMVASIYDNNKI